MKLSTIAVTLFGAALLFSSSALAKDNNKGTLKLAETVSIEGKSLNPGKYTVEWDGTGPAVQVSLVQGKDTVATFAAHLTEQATANSADAYGAATEPDGTKALTAIYLGGKHFVLQLEQAHAVQQSNTQPSQ
jgi:hypothetical protein